MVLIIHDTGDGREVCEEDEYELDSMFSEPKETPPTSHAPLDLHVDRTVEHGVGRERGVTRGKGDPGQVCIRIIFWRIETNVVCDVRVIVLYKTQYGNQK